MKQELNRVGNVFNATFIRFTQAELEAGYWSTTHRATAVEIPNDKGYPPRTEYWTLCGKQLFYEMQETTHPVTCKSCLRMKA